VSDGNDERIFRGGTESDAEMGHGILIAAPLPDRSAFNRRTWLAKLVITF